MSKIDETQNNSSNGNASIMFESMLGALDDEPLNNDSDQEEDDDCDDNTELIQQLEALSENFQEEYLMGAYQAKAEAVDKLKASFRGSKDVSKDD